MEWKQVFLWLLPNGSGLCLCVHKDQLFSLLHITVLKITDDSSRVPPNQLNPYLLHDKCSVSTNHCSCEMILRCLNPSKPSLLHYTQHVYIPPMMQYVLSLWSTVTIPMVFTVFNCLDGTAKNVPENISSWRCSTKERFHGQKVGEHFTLYSTLFIFHNMYQHIMALKSSATSMLCLTWINSPLLLWLPRSWSFWKNHPKNQVWPI